MQASLYVDIDDRALLASIRGALMQLGPQGSRGLLSAIGAAMRASTLDKFREEGTGDHHWQPLQPATIARRRRGRGAGEPKILQDSGKLKGSVTYDADSQEVNVGTDLFYGPFHQDGAPGANIPPRPFLTIARRDGRRLEGLTAHYLERVFS